MRESADTVQAGDIVRIRSGLHPGVYRGSVYGQYESVPLFVLKVWPGGTRSTRPGMCTVHAPDGNRFRVFTCDLEAVDGE
jgi:hypothetical protein